MGKKNGGFDVRDIDAAVRPQDDFYHYANGAWLKRNRIPPAEARWGSFTILRYETEKKLKNLLDARASAGGNAGRMARDFYRSGMDTHERTRLGTKPIAHYQKQIDRIKTAGDLLACIAELHIIGVDAVWSCGVDQDMRHNDRYVFYLGQGGIGMPDRDYYLNDDAESVRVRSAYRPHIARMLQLAERRTPAVTQAAETIYTIERRLAQASMQKEERREVEKIYNKRTVAQLTRLAPNIAWHAYFKSLGAKTPKTVVICQPDFFVEVSRMITDVTLADWRMYLTWHLVNDTAGFLSPKLVRQSFAFYGTVLTGTKKMRPLWRQVLAAVNASVGELVGRAYVGKYFSPVTRKKTNAMVDNLFAAYEARLTRLDWMSAATKQKALRKLRAMTRKIGAPARWRSYRGLRIRPHEYAGNIMRAARFEHQRLMKKLTRPVDRAEWFMNPQTVNAYCNASMNEIVFPAAVLQPPFFNPDADDAINYGAIGMTIGHEMTHNFDDQGKKFDERGRLKNWWTAADTKKFATKSKPLIAQYHAYEVAGGVRVNGQLTLGENIADLGGLAIAYDAYQLRLAKTGRKDIDGFTPEQRFFLGYTLFERENARPEIEKMFALNDPHSPPQFRVNGAVSNLPAFYAAFNVKKGDKLYRSPSSRIRVW